VAQITEREREALIILMEECGEVIQACSKILRFGKDIDKIEALEKECGDMECLVSILHDCDLVSYNNISQAVETKTERLKKYSNLYNREYE
jgi:NTP pyrophosphatase (non-canonical NTP hydrolase)